ncbi:energy transducer TonB [Flavobacteriales bacterium]|jgi:periplasmic protein TonB|nr:energy transducer TonB [Flavobacteriales bacterium]
MIRFTRSITGLLAGAMFTASLFSCAGGPEAEATQDETLDTTSEVVSAEFPGGAAEVMNFIAGEVSYPESARADGVEGKVFVEFTISESGAVTNAHVIESLHPALDSAAVAAAMAMPNWAPATKEGQAISTTITLPVMFRL